MLPGYQAALWAAAGMALIALVTAVVMVRGEQQSLADT